MPSGELEYREAQPSSTTAGSQDAMPNAGAPGNRDASVFSEQGHKHELMGAGVRRRTMM